MFVAALEYLIFIASNLFEAITVVGTATVVSNGTTRGFTVDWFATRRCYNALWHDTFLFTSNAITV